MSTKISSIYAFRVSLSICRTVGQIGNCILQRRLIARDLDKSVQLEILSQAGQALTEEGLRNSSSHSMDASLKLAMEHFDALCEWFPREAQELKDCATAGTAERYFIPMNEARRECVAVTLAHAKFGISASSDPGILGKISGIFRR